ncbi:MAG: hypothetical protein V4773_12075 [Verrucomicrobiota bacterium]
MYPTRQNGRAAFAIFTETVCEGLIPAWHDEKGVPIAYPTEREAEIEIAEMLIEHLEQFIAGERDFDDASISSDFILPVTVLPNGTLCTADGRLFGIKTW